MPARAARLSLSRTDARRLKARVHAPAPVGRPLRRSEYGRLFITLNGDADTILQDCKGRAWNSYQAQDPSMKATFRLLVSKPRTNYQVTDIITRTSQNLFCDNHGYVTISNDGWNMQGLSMEEYRLGAAGLQRWE